MSEGLRILVTGGTLDKVHDTYTEALAFDQDGKSHLPELLTIGRCHFPVTELLFLKDSLDFTDADRKCIAEAVSRAEEQAIVITHGTGTMDQTAGFLAAQNFGKTVILTGSLRPHSFGASDAIFNLGGAIVAAQTMPKGVWAVMNGRVFAAEDISKDVHSGRFDLKR